MQRRVRLGRTLQAQLRQPGMTVRTAADRPVVLSFLLQDWQVVDARNSTAHEPSFIEFPVLVSVRTKPVARIIMPLVREADRDSVAFASPDLFDQAVVQFLVPLPGQEQDDSLAAGQELGTVSPHAIRRIRERNPMRVTGVPSVLGHSSLLARGLHIKWRKWRPRLLKSVHVDDLAVTNAV